MAWSQVRKTVAEIVSPPAELILFCGMSIGYEDDTVNYVRTGRAPLDETVTFVEVHASSAAAGALREVALGHAQRVVASTVKMDRAESTAA